MIDSRIVYNILTVLATGPSYPAKVQGGSSSAIRRVDIESQNCIPWTSSGNKGYPERLDEKVMSSFIRHKPTSPLKLHSRSAAFLLMTKRAMEILEGRHLSQTTTLPRHIPSLVSTARSSPLEGKRFFQLHTRCSYPAPRYFHLWLGSDFQVPGYQY